MMAVIVKGCAMTTDSRQKMIKTAAFLFGERGYAATSFQDVLARSGAPRGSIYHHFPGGKEQLAAEALRWYAGRLRDNMAASTADGGPTVLVVEGYFAATAAWLVKSEFRGGCPIGSVALDLSGDEPLREVVAQAFADWRRVIEHSLLAEGCPADTARSLAALVVAASEGALMLARTSRDLRVYEEVSAQVLAHLRTVLA
jgi:TetR/AcrR family transcriptional regulator, lmrAB and yxaGH operons repressor